MTAKLPPVPPEQQSPEGPGDDTRPDADTAIDKRPENLDEEGRWGNIKQNTTNDGFRPHR